MRRYGQILFALLQREQERRRQSPLEALADVLEPLVFVVMLAVLYSFLNRRNSSPLGGSAILFIATGFYVKFYWISLARISKRNIGARSVRFPVERRLDYIFVHLLLTTIDYSFLAVLGFGFIYVVYEPEALPQNFFAIAGAMSAMLALGFGWGMVNLVLARYFWPWAYLSGLVNRATILFSGIFFLAEYLPAYPRYVLSFNPMLHAIALFRSGFYPNYPELLLDRTYLTYCSLIAVVIGLVLERVTVRYED